MGDDEDAWGADVNDEGGAANDDVARCSRRRDDDLADESEIEIRSTNRVRAWLIGGREWGALAIALAALGLSVVTYLQLNANPTIVASLPAVVSLQNYQRSVAVHIQPNLTVIRKSDVPGVITDFQLTVTGPTASPQFYWCCIGDFAQQDGTFDLRWVQESYPAPVITTAESPQFPYLRFVSAGSDALLTQGHWRAELHIGIRDQESIILPFCIDISQQAASDISSGAGGVVFRMGLPGNQTGCYFEYIGNG